MVYDLMDPPFPVIPRYEMTPKEAKRPYEWYIGEIPRRLALLKQAYQETGAGPAKDLDLSEDSLGKLWAWYLDRVLLERKTPEELEAEKQSTPPIAWNSIQEQKITLGWQAVALDIAIYLAHQLPSSRAPWLSSQDAHGHDSTPHHPDDQGGERRPGSPSLGQLVPLLDLPGGVGIGWNITKAGTPGGSSFCS